MSTRTIDGQGTSTVITAEQHNATRRQKKAKQRSTHRAHTVLDAAGYDAGLQEDNLRGRRLAMLDRLEAKVNATSSPSSREVLRGVVVVYVSEFTTPQQGMSWHERHIVAKRTALGNLKGRLRHYAEHELNTAYNATRR